jgi:hypothetical protein
MLQYARIQLNLQTPWMLQASSMVQYGTNCFEFHVQTCSEMLPHHESINRNVFCVKNLENIWREKIWLILNLDLKMDVNDESS